MDSVEASRRKLRKLWRDPDRFFFDVFRKRLARRRGDAAAIGPPSPITGKLAVLLDKAEPSQHQRRLTRGQVDVMGRVSAERGR